MYSVLLWYSLVCNSEMAFITAWLSSLCAVFVTILFDKSYYSEVVMNLSIFRHQIKLPWKNWQYYYSMNFIFKNAHSISWYLTGLGSQEHSGKLWLGLVRHLEGCYAEWYTDLVGQWSTEGVYYGISATQWSTSTQDSWSQSE